MNHSFNFINQPILSALNDAAHLLPGLKQVDLLFQSQNNSDLQIKRVKAKDDYKIQNIVIEENSKADILAFKNKLKGTRWYEPKELPFSSNSKTAGYGEIFDEILKSILCIGFPNETNGDSDVFVFYFRSDASEFGPMRDDKVLETAQKIVIERLLQSSLRAILSNYQQNRHAMMDFNKNVQGLLLAKQNKIKEQAQVLSEMKKRMDSILMGVLNEVKSEGEIVSISEDARLILYDYLANIPLVKEALQKALIFAKTLSFGLLPNEIVLNEGYFSDLKKAEAIKNQSVAKKADEYSVNTKMYRFLDSLENASKKLVIQGLKLTSSRVGAILEQPITAAAISDKLKNHHKKINLLLQQYPDNWIIIRDRFRPIVNIQERAKEFKVA